MTVQEVIEELDDEVCDICIHRDLCNGFCSDGYGEPVYPPCTETDMVVLVDMEAFREYKKGRQKMNLTEDSFKKLGIENVIYNNPATIIIFTDGRKVVVKCTEKDKYSKKAGLSIAITKSLFESNGAFNRFVEKWSRETESDEVDGCGCNDASYKFDGKLYCADCLIGALAEKGVVYRFMDDGVKYNIKL